MKRKIFHSEAFAWVAVTLWIIIIGISIPLARIFQNFITASLGRNVFIITVLIFLLAGLFLVTLRVFKQPMPKLIISLLWTVLALAICTVWTLKLSNNPEESIHFIEYGVLSVLFFHALSFRLTDWSIYFAAALLTGLVGTFDEVIQWFTPQRYFDFRDIWLNAGAGFLAQVVIAKGIRPSLISSKINPKSIRFVCILAAVQILLFAGCYSNTPVVVQRFINTFPFFSYLKSKDNIMAEYGYRHKDPQIGTFYSRFSLEELKRMDTNRSAEAAKILQQFKDYGTYAQFLKLYNPYRDPFLHELKVHQFRRDEYIWRTLDRSANKDTIRTYCTVAFRENTLLEKYFPKTLQAAALTLPNDAMLSLSACADPQMDYESPVSGDLIASFRWIHVLIVTIALLALLALLAVIARKNDSTCD
jgi:VanZ family protein